MKLTFFLLPVIAAAHILAPRAVCRRSLSRRGISCTKPQGGPPPTPAARPQRAPKPTNPKVDHTRIKMKADTDNSAIRLPHPELDASLLVRPAGSTPRPPGPNAAWDPRRGFGEWRKYSASDPKLIDIESRRGVGGQMYNGKGSIRGGHVRADVQGPAMVKVKDPSNAYGGSRMEHVPEGESKIFHASYRHNSPAKISVQGTAQFQGHDSQLRNHLSGNQARLPDTSGLEGPQQSAQKPQESLM